MAYLVKPDLSEMKYRKKLHESPATMSYIGHPESFPKENWQAFYDHDVEADIKERAYRYIFCPKCNDFTGEVSWQFNQERNRYEIHILVSSSMRLEGYGRKGINLLKQLAAENGIDELYAVVAKTNPATGFFEHLHKEKVEEDQNTATYLL